MGEPSFPLKRRATELVLLFTVGPVFLALGPRWLVTVGILGSGAAAAVALARDPTFPRSGFLNAAGMRGAIRLVLIRTLVIWASLLAVTAVSAPQALFSFPRSRPLVWLAVMVLYPLSAYAQELVFRTLFFHRYADLFARPRVLMLASGLVFGWAHIVVNNLLAIPLAAIAGLLFASTYLRSRSTLLVSIEHALYGDFVFTVGLGSLFYSPARWVAG